MWSRSGRSTTWGSLVRDRRAWNVTVGGCCARRKAWQPRSHRHPLTSRLTLLGDIARGGSRVSWGRDAPRGLSVCSRCSRHPATGSREKFDRPHRCARIGARRPDTQEEMSAVPIDLRTEPRHPCGAVTRPRRPASLGRVNRSGIPAALLLALNLDLTRGGPSRPGGGQRPGKRSHRDSGPHRRPSRRLGPRAGRRRQHLPGPGDGRGTTPDVRPVGRRPGHVLRGVRHPGSHADVRSVREVAQPRACQWNLVRHHLLSRPCVEIEGVLCAPATAEQRRGPRYLAHLTTGAPTIVPPATSCTGRRPSAGPTGTTSPWASWSCTAPPARGMSTGAAAHRSMRADRQYGADLFVAASFIGDHQVAQESRREVVCCEHQAM